MDLFGYLKSQWDRVAAWVFVAVGALALLLGWIGVSGNAFLANQMPYLISGGVGGLFLLGLGAMLWLSADLRDEWYKLDRIERSLFPPDELSTEPRADDASQPEEHWASASPPSSDAETRIFGTHDFDSMEER